MATVSNDKIITITVSGNHPHIGTSVIAGLIQSMVSGLAEQNGSTEVEVQQRYENEPAPITAFTEWMDGKKGKLGVDKIIIKDDGVNT